MKIQNKFDNHMVIFLLLFPSFFVSNFSYKCIFINVNFTFYIRCISVFHSIIYFAICQVKKIKLEKKILFQDSIDILSQLHNFWHGNISFREQFQKIHYHFLRLRYFQMHQLKPTNQWTNLQGNNLGSALDTKIF